MASAIPRRKEVHGSSSIPSARGFCRDAAVLAQERVGPFVIEPLHMALSCCAGVGMARAQSLRLSLALAAFSLSLWSSGLRTWRNIAHRRLVGERKGSSKGAQGKTSRAAHEARPVRVAARLHHPCTHRPSRLVCSFSSQRDLEYYPPSLSLCTVLRCYATATLVGTRGGRTQSRSRSRKAMVDEQVGGTEPWGVRRI